MVGNDIPFDEGPYGLAENFVILLEQGSFHVVATFGDQARVRVCTKDGGAQSVQLEKWGGPHRPALAPTSEAPVRPYCPNL